MALDGHKTPAAVDVAALRAELQTQNAILSME
jgi:hypothetical protein